MTDIPIDTTTLSQEANDISNTQNQVVALPVNLIVALIVAFIVVMIAAIYFPFIKK